MDEYLPQFYTSTNLYWKPLLKNNQYKEIILSSLKYLVKNKWIKLYAFVIMPNHFHYIWQSNKHLSYSKVRASHQKYISHHIKLDLVKNNPLALEEYYVGAKDRAYQFFERNPLSIPLFTPDVIHQKINYIHNNPMHEKWNLCKSPEEYY